MALLQSSAFSLKEKNTAIELLALVQNLERQETELRWVNSDAMLADGMTKLSSQDRIRRFLEDDQQWNLRYNENFVAAKKRKKMPAEEEEPGGHRDLTWLETFDIMCLNKSGHVSLSAKFVLATYMSPCQSAGDPLA